MKSITKRRGAYLPHWTKENGIYAVCFRLADSLPQSRLARIKWERASIEQRAKDRPLTEWERLRLLALHQEKIERFLRSGHGACWLKRPEIASIIRNAFLRFDGARYRLLAWSIMPNHIHVVVQPRNGKHLPSILQSWKGFTAWKANKILGRSGPFWQTEYYDRLIRSRDELRHHIEYAWLNPEIARLKDLQWRWKMPEEHVRTLLESEKPFVCL